MSVPALISIRDPRAATPAADAVLGPAAAAALPPAAARPATVP